MEVLFVSGPNDTAAFLRFHCDFIGVYGVRDITDPPLETGLGVLAHKHWLQIQIIYYIGGSDKTIT